MAFNLDLLLAQNYNVLKFQNLITNKNFPVVGSGFEPLKAKPADLQSRLCSL